MVLLAVDHDLHWTIISLMPMIALSLAEAISGNPKDTTFVSNQDLGRPCLRSSPLFKETPIRIDPLIRHHARHQCRPCFPGSLAVPF
ncbi:hypothetical protein BKA70DRAFT_1281431 [Coprinopsis sp. MPI-PUGE-AT-0042]|nr:hypothetical protein BKA70DRAFT_1281431 [Coprinopsis sp. MPI-PUGE-AT-0042]